MSDSTVDLSVKSRDYYIQRSEIFFRELMDYSKSKYGKVYDFIKYTVVYDIQWIFLMDNIEEILSEDDLNKLKSILYDILNEIEDEFILRQRYHDRNLQYNILIFKHGQMETEVLKDNVKKTVNGSVIDELYYHVFYLDAFEINKNRLNILGYLKSYFKYPEIKIEAVKFNEDDFMNYWIDYFIPRAVGFLEWEYLSDKGYEYKTNLLNDFNNCEVLDENNISKFINDLDFNDWNFGNENELLKSDYIDEVTYNNVKEDVLKKYLNENGEIYESDKIRQTNFNFFSHDLYNLSS